MSSLRGRGHDGHKQRTLADLLLDLRIPRVAAAQLALVEPHLHAKGPQPVRDAPRGVGVIARVAQKNSTAGQAGTLNIQR